MKRWYKVVDDLTLKDGNTVKEDRLVFETTDKALSKRVEKFFQSLMDETETVPLNTPLKISDYNIEAIYSTREDSVFVITKIEPQLKNCADLWNWDEDEPQTETQTETQNSNLTFEKRTMRDCYNCKRYETEEECVECHYEPKYKPPTEREGE